MNEFKLPDVGEGLTEAEIVRWCVAVGDTVAINDVLVEIETAKSIVELPSPYAGEVRTLLVAEGDTVHVGTPIIAIGGGEAPAPEPDESVPEVDPVSDPVEAAPERQAMLVGYGPRTDVPVRRRRVPRAAAPSRVASVDTEKIVQKSPPPQERPLGRPPRPMAKPPVRKLAKDLGVDLADIRTADGVITRADVHAFVGSAAVRHPERAVEAPPVMTSDEEERIPIKGVRKWTAEAMVRSAFTAPHVTEWVTVDVSRTMDLVATLRASRAFEGLKVSPTLIAAKAVCLALRTTPQLNARWDEDAQEIVIKKSVNLGVAAATARGLVVPNIVGADRMSLVELARALGELTATARAGRTQPAQMTGGTFSLTNIGVFGVDAGTPILNPGESGILALGAIERRPWVDENDQIVPRWVTTLALSFDHRVVDGEQGSRFLADVAAILRDPAMALTH
ncbi:dihydrolipoamide acetyltransferase family protein [Aeromicrobium chenweiae]|uniref:Dihydrolipoamide acetyltransferase component of pyruvate dehydrogenase complex n=1 Tax=Aeromicrobium chenweiae TaxID=2079793 RepID=A0A2S0WRF2_9ACTN|nr:dihydrolipoamide acetyltransferase family protein [Aeromicrobium chenweiae]AWB93814.1 branched-chain alpha-keto acid dehydrogenase subunit E2 [Aeromicrobium chenweiae]TGN30859.1 2-oxo acid dehydrogenase subunit E2 [Aeromicrobium chenweiae]